MRLKLKRSARFSGLTLAQRCLFAYGWDLLPAGADEPYPDDAAAREGWFSRRSELLAIRRQGGRLSWGYITYELDLDAQDLTGRDVFDICPGFCSMPDERAARYERAWPTLLSAHGPGTGEPCGDASFLRAQQLTAEERDAIAKHFDLASDWHIRRGRPDVAGAYARRAAVVRSVGAAVAGVKEKP